MRLLFLLCAFIFLPAAFGANLPIPGAENYLDNLIQNPGFESGSVGWTASGGSIKTANTTAALYGKYGYDWAANAAAQTLVSRAITIPSALKGKRGFAVCYVQAASAAGAATLMSVDNGTTDLTTAQQVLAIVGSPSRNVFQFVYPTSGSVRLKFTSVNSTEPELYIDGCFMGDGDYEARIQDSEFKAYKRNYVVNPDGRPNASLGITATGTTVTRNATAPYLGVSSELQFPIAAATQSVTFALNPFEEYLRNVGICSYEIPFKADANAEGVLAEIVRNGSIVAQKYFYTPTPAGSPGIISGVFPCGDLTNATTLVIQGTTANTSNMKVGRVRVSEADWSKDQVGGTVIGTEVITGCSAAFAGTSTSYADFAAGSGCVYANTGSLLPPSTLIPGFQIPALPPGTIEVTMSGGVAGTGTPTIYYRVTDGTTPGTDEGQVVGQQSVVTPSFVASMPYAGSGSTTAYRIQYKAIAGTSNIGGNAGNPLKFTVKWFPSSTQVVNTKTQNGDFDDIAYTPVFTNFGTPTSVDCKYSRAGKYLTANCLFTTGTGTATAGQISLPTGLVVDGAATAKIVGAWTYNQSNNLVADVIATGGTSYLQLSYMNQTGGGFVPIAGNGLGAGSLVSFTARLPILGWTKSNTAVNMAGDPGSYSVNLTATAGSWLVSGTTTVDLTGGTSITKASEVNQNFGTVTCGTGGLAGCSVTPKITGSYNACFTTTVNNSAAGNASTVYFTDGNNNNIVLPLGWHESAAGYQYPVSGCGLVSLTAGTASTIKLRMQSNGGNTQISAPYGSSLQYLNFTLYPTTQNLPGLLGGGANAEVSAQVQMTASYSATASSPIIFPTIGWDPTGMYSTTTGRFTVPANASGHYEMSCTGFLPSVAHMGARLYKNGVFSAFIMDAAATGTLYGGNASASGAAGDYFTVVPDTTGTYGYSAGSYGPVCTLKKIN